MVLSVPASGVAPVIRPVGRALETADVPVLQGDARKVA
jgi:hypothetical protein